MNLKKNYLFLLPISIFSILALIRLINPLQFWVDEMFHVFAAIGILETGEPLLPSEIPYDRSIITTLLVAGSFKLFGVSEITARLPFIIIGILSLIVTYFFIKAVLSQEVALVTVALLSISSWQIYWSVNARMYILLQFLYVTFLFIVYELSKELVPKNVQKEKNNKKIIALVLASIAIIILTYYVHQFYILFLPIGFSYFAYLVFKMVAAKNNLFDTKHSSLFFIVTISIILVLINVLIENIPFAPQYTPIGMRMGLDFYAHFLIRYFPILSFFVFFSLFHSEKENYDHSVIMIGFFVPFVLLTLFLDSKCTRYLFFIYPLFIALASNGIFELLQRINHVNCKLISKYAPMLIILLFLIPNGVGLYELNSNDYQPLPYETPHPNWQHAAEYVQKNMVEDDVILSTMPICSLYYLGYTDYWLRQNEYYAFEDMDGILRDRYTGVIILKDYDMFKDETNNKNGWVIADQKLNSYFSDPEVIEHIDQSMILIPDGSDENIRVYRFEYT
ncbi:glycosyltransferase family 39 protein [Methanococcoides methylutens]|uniref:Uncharacterized protein n=1 Tax=Methanococcoides methylutens MM1 TaxID=1434104 RepID=A0A0E3STR6_METMT|nr:glycosyltransferase family 39 protein [Methanococcoides methylutens]AKB86157.1 hypothetical protein MCMEM_2104 [Methanococcoides methylutens MM1]